MKKSLYNPLPTDFSVFYDINGDMKPLSYTIPSYSVVSFDEPIYDHVKKHLTDEIMNVRGLNPTIPKNKEDILKEISVEK